MLEKCLKVLEDLRGRDPVKPGDLQLLEASMKTDNQKWVRFTAFLLPDSSIVLLTDHALASWTPSNLASIMSSTTSLAQSKQDFLSKINWERSMI